MLGIAALYTDDEYLELQEKLVQANGTINSLLARLAIETTKRLEAEDRADRFSQHIMAIRRSISWKVTTPIRALRRLLK